MELDVDTRKHGVGKTALVVDDNPAIRKMIVAAFLSDGFKLCGEAENGKEALELANQIHPDIITLDLSMPVMNGLEAATALRKIFPKTPIILFTLFEDGILQTEAAKLGINLTLSKSTPLAHLIVLAHRLLGTKD